MLADARRSASEPTGEPVGGIPVPIPNAGTEQPEDIPNQDELAQQRMEYEGGISR